MNLSNDIISQFAKLTTGKKDTNKETTVYGTVKIYDGKTCVKIDGSDLLTPVDTTTEVKNGERVTILIKNHSAVIMGNTTDPSASVSTTDGISEEVSKISAEVGEFNTLIAGKADVEDLTATNAEIDTLKANKADISELIGISVSVEQLYTVKADVEDLNATNATIETLKAEKADVSSLEAFEVNVENLMASKADIDQLEATNAWIREIDAVKANVADLNVTNATINDLEADIAEIGSAVIDKANISDLNATNAAIGSLDTELADIQNLVNGNLTSDNIASLNLTSANTTIQNAMIKDAMIDSLTASKLNAGTIDTNKITIQSTDGSMILSGSVQQFKDENGVVRIQIGKDSGGNFTFILYDESGRGVLIDESGIKSSDAIADGLIVDAKVAEGANISGSKLDIASVITEVNNDNSTTIKSNKIYLSEQGQSLEVAFNSLKTQVETIQDITIDGDLTSVIEQVQSNTTQINANKEGISTLVAENTMVKEQISNLDGVIEEVNTTLTNQYSSLQQDLSGFKTIVGDTYTTKSEFNNLEIGGRNLYIIKNSVEGYLSAEDVLFGAGSLQKERTSEYIPVTTGTYQFQVWVTPANETLWMAYILYDSNHNMVGGRVAQHGGSILPNGQMYNSYTIPITNESVAYIRISARMYEDGLIKFEKGNKATDWTPAPEDVQNDIDDVGNRLGFIEQDYITSSELEQTSSAIIAKFTEAGGYNLIKNSTGANWTTAGWTCSSQAEMGISSNDNIPLLANSHYFYLDNGTNTTESSAYSPRFKLKPNTTYRFSGCFHNYTTCPSFDIFVLSSTTLNENDTTTDFDGIIQLWLVQNTNGQWKKYTCVFTTPTNVKSGYIRIDNNGYNSAGTDTNKVHWSSLILTEGEMEVAWSPSPDEVYSGLTTIDKSGVKVEQSNYNGYTNMCADGFYVNDGSEDVIRVDQNGAYIKGRVIVESDSIIPTTTLSGTINSSQLNSTITNDISTAKTNATTALNTANSVSTTVNNNEVNWSNAYNRVNEWAYGAVTDSTTIDGGLIQANTIMANKIVLGDTTNLCVVSPYGYKYEGDQATVVTVGSTKYFRIGRGGTSNYDKLYLNRGLLGGSLKKGDVYRIYVAGYASANCSINTLVRAFYTDGSYLDLGKATITLSTSYSTYEQTLTLSNGYSNSDINKTIEDILLCFEHANHAYFVYVTDILINKKATGELIVDGAITADKIAANAVTTDKLSANAITADKIAAGAITTEKLAADAVTVGKMRIGDMTNLCVTDPNSNVYEATVTTDENGVKLFLLGSSTTAAYHKLELNRMYGGNRYFRPGDKFRLTFEANGENAKITFLIRAIYTDGTFENYASYTIDNISTGDRTIVTKEIDIRALTQTNKIINYVMIAFEVPNTTDRYWFRDISLVRKANGELIVDGAITADKIAANAITADKIAAGAISASMITTGTMSADRISGGTLSATDEIHFVGGARIFGNTGENGAGLTISAGGFSFSGATHSFLYGNWTMVDGVFEVVEGITCKTLTASSTITATGSITANDVQINTGEVYLGTINATTDPGRYVRFGAGGYLVAYNGFHCIQSNGSPHIFRAGTIYSNGTVVTSDKRKKTDIRYVGTDKQTLGDSGLMSPNTNITTSDMHEFISELPLTSFRYVEEVGDNRDFTHYGFLTQDIIYTKVGSELVAMLDENKRIGDENDYTGYCQEKLIAFIIGALQEEIKARKELEKKLAEKDNY